MKDKGRGLYKAEIQGIRRSTRGSDTSVAGNLTFPKSAIAQKATSPSLTICSRGKNSTPQISPGTTTCSGPGAGVKDRSDEVAVQEGLGERHVRWLALLAFVSQNC